MEKKLSVPVPRYSFHRRTSGPVALTYGDEKHIRSRLNQAVTGSSLSPDVRVFKDVLIYKRRGDVYELVFAGEDNQDIVGTKSYVMDTIINYLREVWD